MSTANSHMLRFLHFNDVARLVPAEREPLAALARFQTSYAHYKEDPKYKNQPQLIVLCSGNDFGPRSESGVTKGSQPNLLLIESELIRCDRRPYGSHLEQCSRCSCLCRSKHQLRSLCARTDLQRTMSSTWEFPNLSTLHHNAPSLGCWPMSPTLR